MNVWRGLAPVAVLAVTGCLASKADILLLQDEIHTLRATQARSDTVRRAQNDSALMLAVRSNDSLRALAQRFGAFQANVGGELFEIGKQLITIQELTGMSSKRIMDLRSAYEERVQSQAATDPAGAPASPGPAQLFGASYELLRRGSPGSARAGFEELLRRYPDFENAATAQLYIGQAFADEKRIVEADSVYRLVVKTYPKSVDAPTALYKWGLSRLQQGKPSDARDALQQVIREYPRSPEAELAADRLKTIK
jgi:tol-pal system protein YbgF